MKLKIANAIGVINDWLPFVVMTTIALIAVVGVISIMIDDYMQGGRLWMTGLAIIGTFALVLGWLLLSIWSEKHRSRDRRRSVLGRD